MIIDNACDPNFCHFALSHIVTVSEISTFHIKMPKLAISSKFRTHDLEILSPNYEKAHLLIIGNIAAKFEEATPCSYTDMLQTK